MKKICYVTTVPGTLRAFVLKSAEYLHSTGQFDISFICNPDPAFQASLPEYIRFFPVRMTRGVGFDGLRAIREMDRIFRRERFDLVQYSTPNAACYASIAAKRARVPVRLYCQWGIVYVGFSGVRRRIFKAMEKRICRNSTRIEPDSRGNLLFAREEGLYSEAKSAVIWNGSASGVSLERFDLSQKAAYRAEIREKHGIPSDAFVYGFVGRINADKGINELFSAFRGLLEAHRDAYLLVVGSPELSAAIDGGLYAWAEGSPNVVFAGHTDTPERYMAAMDCFVLPSYREGFGMTVVEAQAMAVPVIVTNIPGPTDGMIGGETGLIVEKKDATGLQAAMERMFVSPELGPRFGAAGRRLVEERFEQGRLFRKIYEDRAALLGIPVEPAP